MKRSTWVSLIFLGGGLGLCAHLWFGELNSHVSMQGEIYAKHTRTFTKHIRSLKKKSDSLFEKHPEMRSLPSAVNDRDIIDSEFNGVNALDTELTRLDEFLAANNGSDNTAVYNLINELAMVMQARHERLGPKGIPIINTYENRVDLMVKQTPSNEAFKRLQAQSTWFSDFDGSLNRTLNLRSKGLTDEEISALDAQGNALVNRYPNQVKLAGRVAEKTTRIKGLNARVQSLGNTLQTAKAAAKKERAMFARVGAEMTAAVMTLEEARKEWTRDVALVGMDQDKILIDMRKGGNTSFEHKYRIITDGKTQDTPWQTVTKSVYAQHREHLGMTIYSKPEGVFPEDAILTAAPPGYNYVGNTRYGRWRERNGMSYWEFYGRYALMRDLFWGIGGYRPIYRSEYRSYRRSRSSRRPYFGAKRQYGTAKAITKKRYAKSSYATSKKRSSGGYSGSKYSGSRRSGGYRSSRYRGSSFGGGGK